MDIAEMLRLQAEFSDLYWRDRRLDPTTGEGRRSILREQVLAAHAELTEILEADSGWKPHRASGPEVSEVRGRVVEEVVDVTKILFAILLAHGVTPDEFSRVYREKSDVVVDRYRYRRVIENFSPLSPVLVVRAEGVIYDLRRETERWVQKDRSPATLYDENPRRLVYHWASYGGLGRVEVAPSVLELLQRHCKPLKGRVLLVSSLPARECMTLYRDLAGLAERAGIGDVPILFNDDPVTTALDTVPVGSVLSVDPFDIRAAERRGVKVIDSSDKG